MRIGELSHRTGVSRRSLRYYEDRGLLVSSRAASGQRHYDDDHVRRVGLVRAFLTAGLSSATIAEMVPCMAQPTAVKARRAAATMDRERARISTAIDALAVARAALDDLIDVNRTFLVEHADRPGADRPGSPAALHPVR